MTEPTTELPDDTPNAFYEVRVLHNLASGTGKRLFKHRDRVVEVARLYIPAPNDFTAMTYVTGLLSPCNKRAGHAAANAYWKAGNRPLDYGDCVRAAGRAWSIGEFSLENVGDAFTPVVQDAPGTVALHTPGSAPPDVTKVVPADTIPDPDPWKTHDADVEDPWDTPPF